MLRKITLSGLSENGKERICKHGLNWLVIDKQQKLNESIGPWLYIKPIYKHIGSCWMKEYNDPDLQIKLDN